MGFAQKSSRSTLSEAEISCVIACDEASLRKSHFVSLNLWSSHALRCVFYFVALCAPSYGSTLEGHAVAIADGDTITVLDGNQMQHKVRLASIDAPERKQPFGTVSRQYLAKLVFGRKVTVEWHKRDQYKRIVGKVLVDGLDANLEQVRAGLAWHYKNYMKEQSMADQQTYAAAEREARRLRLGLWKDLASIPPWEFRKKSKEKRY